MLVRREVYTMRFEAGLQITSILRRVGMVFIVRAFIAFVCWLALARSPVMIPKDWINNTRISRGSRYLDRPCYVLSAKIRSVG